MLKSKYVVKTKSKRIVPKAKRAFFNVLLELETTWNKKASVPRHAKNKKRAINCLQINLFLPLIERWIFKYLFVVTFFILNNYKIWVSLKPFLYFLIAFLSNLEKFVAPTSPNLIDCTIVWRIWTKTVGFLSRK